MRPMAGARSTAGEYPALALRPTQVDARCKRGIAPRRTFGHAVSNPRIRACSPTSSDLAPSFGSPQCKNRSGVPKALIKPLKKDIRAVSAPHENSTCGLEVPRQQFVDAAYRVASGDGFQGCLEIGEGFDIVDLRGRDEGGDPAPSPGTFVMTGKERVFPC